MRHRIIVGITLGMLFLVACSTSAEPSRKTEDSSAERSRRAEERSVQRTRRAAERSVERVAATTEAKITDTPLSTRSPTATAVPTEAPAPTPTVCPVKSRPSTVGSNLVPFKAITRDSVKYSLAREYGEVFVGPENYSDTFVIVFFGGIQLSSGISINSMDWILVDRQCTQYMPIGFGFPVGQYPIQMYGLLDSGRFTVRGNEGGKPLIGLIFVAPQDITDLKLLDPQNRESILAVTNDWYPELVNRISRLENSSTDTDAVFSRPMSGRGWGMSDHTTASVTTPAPVSTNNSCVRKSPITADKTDLAPFRAITRDKIRMGTVNDEELYAYARNPNNTIVAVFFGLTEDGAELSLQDMDWVINDDRCGELRNIGFGISAELEPVTLQGDLQTGYISLKGDDALLALLFVVPKGTEGVTLFDPQGNKHNISVSNNWIPGMEYAPESLILGPKSGWRIQNGGELWMARP